MSEHRLPELREPSRRRARVVDNALGLTLAVLLVLVAGWGVALSSLRFSGELPVTGTLAEVGPDGRARVHLRVAAAAGETIRRGDVVRVGFPGLARGSDRPLPGAVTLVAAEGTGYRLEAEVDLRGLGAGERAHLRPGMPVEGRVVARSVTGFERLAKYFVRSSS